MTPLMVAPVLIEVDAGCEVIVGAVLPAATMTVNVPVATPPLNPEFSQSLMVIGKLPDCVGIPLMELDLFPVDPPVERVNPVGRVPTTCQLPGVDTPVPLAVNTKFRLVPVVALTVAELRAGKFWLTLVAPETES